MKKAPVLDSAFEEFQAEHTRILGASYIPTRADFVWLSRIRKANAVPSRASPPRWRQTVCNYLASPLGKYTLADLCNRLAVFRNGPVDKFGKLFGGSADEQRRQRTHDVLRRFVGQLDGGIQ